MSARVGLGGKEGNLVDKRVEGIGLHELRKKFGGGKKWRTLAQTNGKQNKLTET